MWEEHTSGYLMKLLNWLCEPAPSDGSIPPAMSMMLSMVSVGGGNDSTNTSGASIFHRSMSTVVRVYCRDCDGKQNCNAANSRCSSTRSVGQWPLYSHRNEFNWSRRTTTKIIITTTTTAKVYFAASNLKSQCVMWSLDSWRCMSSVALSLNCQARNASNRVNNDADYDKSFTN